MITALGEVRALVFLFGIDLLLKKMPLEEVVLRKEHPMEHQQYCRFVRKLTSLRLVVAIFTAVC
jgi:hypothetical protein